MPKSHRRTDPLGFQIERRMLLEKIKKHIKRNWDKERISRTLDFIGKNPLAGLLVGLFFGRNLSKLALIYNTDKYGAHHYTEHYQRHLRRFKYRKIRLLEIGVGGSDSPHDGGNSLRMWKRYFPFGKIYALDINDKSPQEEKRISLFRGNQADAALLNDMAHQTGPLDIIIDDGSHINEHVIKTFEVLFHHLKDGGIYIVEDTQTSYWPEYGGDSEDLNNPNTAMNYFKRLTDSLNNREFLVKNYTQTYFDRKIISVHFYHNLIFIYKGNNDEPSNMVIDNAVFRQPGNP